MNQATFRQIIIEAAISKGVGHLLCGASVSDALSFASSEDRIAERVNDITSKHGYKPTPAALSDLRIIYCDTFLATVRTIAIKKRAKIIR